jgi:hypothetical protein
VVTARPWDVAFSKAALKDAKKLSQAGLRPKAESLIELIRRDPFQTPPPYEKLVGDLAWSLVTFDASELRDYLTTLGSPEAFARQSRFVRVRSAPRAKPA